MKIDYRMYLFQGYQFQIHKDEIIQFPIRYRRRNLLNPHQNHNLSKFFNLNRNTRFILANQNKNFLHRHLHWRHDDYSSSWAIPPHQRPHFQCLIKSPDCKKLPTKLTGSIILVVGTSFSCLKLTFTVGIHSWWISQLDSKTHIITSFQCMDYTLQCKVYTVNSLYCLHSKADSIFRAVTCILSRGNISKRSVAAKWLYDFQNQHCRNLFPIQNKPKWIDRRTKTWKGFQKNLDLEK